MVIEILSLAIVVKDFNLRYSIYESQGISCYLIISPDIEEVEVYELNNGVLFSGAKGEELIISFLTQ